MDDAPKPATAFKKSNEGPPTPDDLRARGAGLPEDARDMNHAVNIDLVENPDMLKQVCRSTRPVVVRDKDGTQAGVAFSDEKAWYAITFDYRLVNPYRIIDKEDWTVTRPSQEQASKQFLHVWKNLPPEEREEVRDRLAIAGRTIGSFFHRAYETNPALKAKLVDPLHPRPQKP